MPRVTDVHRGLFQWDVGEGLSEKEVFEHRSEGREEKNQARSWGDAFLADSRKGSAFTVKCRGWYGWRK